MSEPRVCFICGRNNPRNSRVCANCAASYDMERPFAPDEAPETPLILVPEETAPPSGRVPLPPQLRPIGEPATRPAAREQEAVTVEEEAAPQKETLAEEAPPTLMTVTCASCQEETDPSFSFCTHCGADLPHNAPRRESAPRAARTAELPQGVRDTRAAMRRIAEAYRQQEQDTGARRTTTTQNAARQVQAQAAVEERREVNPTVNAILSFFFPGVGQMLNGQPGKGFFLIVAGFLSVSLIGLPAFGIGIIVARVLVAVDAYRIGERRRKGEKIEPGEWDFS